MIESNSASAAGQLMRNKPSKKIGIVSMYGAPTEESQVAAANTVMAKQMSAAGMKKAGDLDETLDAPNKLKFRAKAKKFLGKESATSAAGSLRAERLVFHPRFVESAFDEQKRTAQVIIIQEGTGNKRDKHYYGADTLRQAVADKVFDGAQAYSDHPSADEDINRPERSVKDLIGYYSDSKIVSMGGKTALAATLKIQDGADWAIGLIKEAIAYNKLFPNKVYVGISINADGEVSPTEKNGETVNYVTKITEAFSADVVTKPARGGRFLALVESAQGARKRESIMTNLIESAARLRSEIESGVGEVDKDELLSLLTHVQEAKATVADARAKDGSLGEAKDEKAKEADDSKDEAKKDGEGEDGQPDDDKKEDDDEKDVSKKMNEKKSKEAAIVNDSKHDEDLKKQVSVTQESEVKTEHPALYEAAVREATKNIEEDTAATVAALRKEVAELRTEKTMRESYQLVKAKLIESKLPEAAAKKLSPSLIGKTAEEIDALIETESNYLEAIGYSAKRVQGAPERVTVRESDDTTSNTSAIFAGLGG